MPHQREGRVVTDDNGWFDPAAPPPERSEADALAQEVVPNSPIRAWVKLTSGDRVIIETSAGLLVIYREEDERP